jgi:hypothetical protein
MIEQSKRFLLKFPTVRHLASVIKRGQQPADHSVKQAAIRQLAEQYGTRIFVETGTFRGDMVEAMKQRFDRLYSIELNEEFCHAAKSRFATTPHVEILFGDSGEKLKEIMPRLTGPSLFWLDGHFSGGDTAKGLEETPVMAELNHILDAPDLGHVIIVDDARLFGVDPAYPTISAMTEAVLRRRPNLEVSVADDAIRFVPTVKI